MTNSSLNFLPPGGGSRGLEAGWGEARSLLGPGSGEYSTSAKFCDSLFCTPLNARFWKNDVI